MFNKYLRVRHTYVTVCKRPVRGPMMNNECPNCSAPLVHRHVDERSIRALGGQTITRVIGTGYKYSCGAVVFQNEHYPNGTIEIDCQRYR
jgi:hypothetical protein